MLCAFFHWGLHAWAVYALPGLSAAYFSYRQGLPMFRFILPIFLLLMLAACGNEPEDSDTTQPGADAVGYVAYKLILARNRQVERRDGL